MLELCIRCPVCGKYHYYSLEMMMFITLVISLVLIMNIIHNLIMKNAVVVKMSF